MSIIGVLKCCTSISSVYPLFNEDLAVNVLEWRDLLWFTFSSIDSFLLSRDLYRNVRTTSFFVEILLFSSQCPEVEEVALKQM